MSPSTVILQMKESCIYTCTESLQGNLCNAVTEDTGREKDTSLWHDNKGTEDQIQEICLMQITMVKEYFFIFF